MSGASQSSGQRPGEVQEGRDRQEFTLVSQSDQISAGREGGRSGAAPNVSSPSAEHHPTALSPPGLGRQPQGAWAAEKLMVRPDG